MKVYFKEEQGMPSWAKILIVFQSIMALVLVGAFWLRDWNANGTVADDTPWTFAIISLIMGSMTWLIFAMKMTTEVIKEGIRLKYFPFKRKWKMFSFSDVESMEVKRGKLLTDFGGWGYGKGWGKKISYTADGDFGLGMTMKNGKYIFIGTKKPKVLEKALQEINQYGEGA